MADNNDLEKVIGMLIENISKLNQTMKPTAKDQVAKSGNDVTNNETDKANPVQSNELKQVKTSGIQLTSQLKDFQNQSESFAGSLSDTLVTKLNSAIEQIDTGIDTSSLSNLQTQIEGDQKIINTAVQEVSQTASAAKVNLAQTYRETKAKETELANIYVPQGIKNRIRNRFFYRN